MRPIPVVLSIDVEPEERQIDEAAPKDWEGFEKSFRFFGALRPRLEEATGAPVNFSWYFRMDPQIKHTYGQSWWAVKRYEDIVQRLELAGDELGLHTHAWRWDGASRRWIADHGDQQWVEHCLNTSFDAFRSAFGRPCISFRFGDHWMNNQTMALLESLGVKFDLTLEPGMKEVASLKPGESHTGSLPDSKSAPRRPYKPSREDFRRPAAEGGRDLWMIPVSTGRKAGRFAGLKRAARELGIDLQERHDRIPLNIGFDGPLFREMLDSLLDEGEPYLAPVARTDAPVTAPDNLEQNAQYLLSHSLAKRFRFVRPADAIELLTQPEIPNPPILEQSHVSRY